MRRILIPLLLLVLAVFLWQATRESEEDRIRKVLREGKEAIEREDLPGVMAHISRSYQDAHGLNFLALRGLFQRVFATYDGIRIHVEREEVVLEGEDRAKARVWAWVEAQRGGEGIIACGSGDPCEVELELGKERGDWLVMGAMAPEEVGEWEDFL